MVNLFLPFPSLDAVSCKHLHLLQNKLLCRGVRAAFTCVYKRK